MTATGAPPPSHPVWRMTKRILFVVTGVYLVVLLAAWIFQRSLIYFPVRLDGPPSASDSAGAEVVSFPSSEGVRITALYVPPAKPDAPVVFLAHGNAGNVLTWRHAIDPYVRMGLGGFLLDPRGYGWSEGSPSEKGWHEDGEAALRWLAAKGIGPERLILHGISIGSGIVVPLAAKHPVRGLVLQSAFTSLVDAASEAYPFFPCAWILRDRFDNLASASGVKCPVLLIHGSKDVLVSVSHSKRLAEAFGARATLRIAEDAGHNDLSMWSGYPGALSEFVRALR